jgi:ketosteroid isomerase-like protein
MSEESTTPSPREIALQMTEALSRADFDAYMRHFAKDAVWVSRFGTRLEGITAIRSYTEEFNASVEGFRAELLEVDDLGGGVTLIAARQGGHPGGSASELLEHVAFVSVLVDGLVESMTTYSDIDEARAAAERLAKERADG